MAQEPTVREPLAPVTIGVASQADVKRTQEAVRRFAETIGFSETEREELTLVGTELASNLMKHAEGGVIRLHLLQTGDRLGIQIESEDNGPGIPDIELAITDGYSTTGSLGTGLGTVNRLMDHLDFLSRPQAGLQILCQRWLRPTIKTSPRWLEFGAATRSCRRLPENGDAIVMKQWEGNALVGVIDGLGHGRFAQKAAQAARQYVEQHFDQPLESLFRGVGRACQATRGVVMALGRFDLARHTVALASIGNVETRLIGTEHFHIIVRRGVLGLNAPNPVVSESGWTAASILIMHSDGLRTRWQWEEFQDVAQDRPAAIARRLLKTLGKPEDDATVVVVKNTAS